MKKIILSSIVAAVIFSGCTEETKKEVEVKKEVEIKTENTTKENVDIIKQKSSEIFDSSKEIVKAISSETKNIVNNSSDITKDVVEKAKVVTQEVVVKAETITKDVTADINKSIDNVIESKKDSSVNAKALYMKCAGCHGQTAEIHALGKSQIIKDWEADKIEESLLGYKNGTYGGNMKGVMIGQVMNLSNEDIKALSLYISNF